jgi:hypothetical protein
VSPGSQHYRGEDACDALCAASQEVEQKHHHGDDQQHMDQTARDMEYESQEPENNQYNADKCQHKLVLFRVLRRSVTGLRLLIRRNCRWEQSSHQKSDLWKYLRIR